METDAAIDATACIAGGSNVLISGVVPRYTAYIASIGMFALATTLSLVTVVIFDVGLGVLALSAVAINAGWWYSAPPLALASHGLGEVDVALTTGILVPVTAYYLQTSMLTVGLWSLCIPLAVLAFATSLATALPDVKADRLAGKRTLAVRLGQRRAVVFLLMMVIAGWILFGYTVTAGRLGVSAVTLFPVPAFLGPIVYFAPGAARGSNGAAARVAAATVTNLGWMGLAGSTTLFWCLTRITVVSCGSLLLLIGLFH